MINQFLPLLGVVDGEVVVSHKGSSAAYSYHSHRLVALRHLASVLLIYLIHFVWGHTHTTDECFLISLKPAVLVHGIEVRQVLQCMFVCRRSELK